MRSLGLASAVALCVALGACHTFSPYPTERVAPADGRVLRGDAAKREIDARRDKPHEGKVEGTSVGTDSTTTRTLTYRDGSVGVVTIKSGPGGKETEFEFRPAN